MIWNSKNPEEVGIQVVISNFNNGPLLEKSLRSVENALLGYKWILIIADDCSEDDSWQILSAYKSLSAEKYILERFSKALNAGEAKNRAITLGLPYRDSHPCICLFDSDDFMGEKRISHLLPQMLQGDYQAVIGDHVRYGLGMPDNGFYYSAAPHSAYLGHFGPWAFLFHSSLIPIDGRLFREDLKGYEDGSLYNQWLIKGVRTKACPGEVCHVYNRRENTVFTPPLEDEAPILKKFEDVKFETFFGKNINLGLDTQISFILSIDDKTRFDMDAFRYNVSFFNEIYDIEFLILDKTHISKVRNLIQHPYVKEMACGIVKYIPCFNKTESELNKIIFTTSKGALAFVDSSRRLDLFLMDRIRSQTEGVASYEGFPCFTRDFFASNFL